MLDHDSELALSSYWLDEVDAVMSTDGGRGREVQGIENPYGICLVGKRRDLFAIRPAGLSCLAGGRQASTCLPAAEDEGNDAPDHVLVDAGQRGRLHLQASLLGDFPAQAVNDLLAEFEDSPGRLPVAIVTPPDEQSPVMLIDHHGRDAYRVPDAIYH